MNDILASAPLKSDLTMDEQARKEQLELVIKSANDMNARAVQALTEIRDKRLYRNKYATFEDYCRLRWGHSRAQINREIAAAHVVEVLAPIGAKIENESVARPLVGLTDEQMVAAFEVAKEQAGDKPLTAKIIRKAAAQFKPERPAKPVVEKSRNTTRPVLDPVFQQLAKVEQAALACKSKRVLKEVSALRELLLQLAQTNAEVNPASEVPAVETSVVPIDAVVDGAVDEPVGANV
jgi:hypothetical protein